MEIDYLIIGGGSAGCLLAAKLSENPDNQVLLIEAGGSQSSPLIQIPLFTALTLPLWFKNWHYITEPQPGLGNRRGYQPRGKVLGGSSSINAMIYTRGQKEDYDDWAKTLHDETWSYQSVLNLFREFEANQQIHDRWHGTSGQLQVTDLIEPNPASRCFVQAGMNCGYPYNRDFNGETQAGVGFYQVTQTQGKRLCAADAFLTPILPRKNLTILLHARALKLNLKGKTCEGALVYHRGQSLEFKARKKVILSAGSINSPHLLLLSGIGPRDELKRFNLDCLHELPGVGLNFHDHPDYAFRYRARDRNLVGFSPGYIWRVIKAYRLQRKGQRQAMISTNYSEAGGFLSTDPKEARPDIQLHFVIGIIDNHVRRLHFNHGMSCHVCVLRPKSRGRIGLKSANPFKAPLIDPNFLAEEEDLNILLKGYKMTREIMEDEAFSTYKKKELYPAKETDASIIDLLRRHTDTIYHPVGSCRMGLDPMAVVDNRLHVHGLKNLMIVDASIMPKIVSGNTNAPTMMIALQAMKFIKTP